jgi:hypothetical protein
LDRRVSKLFISWQLSIADRIYLQLILGAPWLTGGTEGQAKNVAQRVFKKRKRLSGKETLYGIHPVITPTVLPYIPYL